MVDDVRVPLELLRRIVRWNLSAPAPAPEIEEAAAGVNWAHVVWLGRRHRVLLLLHAALAGLPRLTRPQWLDDQLRRLQHVSAARQLAGTNDLVWLGSALSARSIPALALSDVAFAERYYDQPALCDVGLLTGFIIHSRDRLAAEAPLTEAGYVVLEDPLTYARTVFGGVVLLDEHTALTPLAGGPADRVWERADRVSIGDTGVPTLSAVDWFRYWRTCDSGRVWTLRGAFDLASMARRQPDEPWDADLVIGMAGALQVLDQPIPDDIARQLESHPDGRDAAERFADGIRSGERVMAPEPANPHGGDTWLGAYRPTPHPVVEEMLRLAEVGPDDVVYDLGCGDGRAVIAAATRHGARAVGIDEDARMIASARRNAAGVDDRVVFHVADALDVDAREATVIFLYLEPWGMPRVHGAVVPRLKPGTRIVSQDVTFTEWPPARVSLVTIGEGPLKETTFVYLWVVE